VFSLESKGNSNSKGKETTSNRLIDYFLIGEKAIEKNVAPDVQVTGIRPRWNFDDINAFSIIDVKINNSTDIFEFLKGKSTNILLVTELRKRGEKTWNRISIINKYTMKVTREITRTPSPEEKATVKNDESPKPAPSPQEKQGTVKNVESLQPTSPPATETPKDSDSRINPFYIVNEILSDNPYIREGDYVQVFFFDDKIRTLDYRYDLKKAQEKSLPLASINSQEMYLITTGSTPEKYSAKAGDTIRLRFLRAEYSIKHSPQRQEKQETVKTDESQKLASSPHQYADFVSVEDEDIFTYKEYGIKLFISPTAVYGSNVGTEFDWGNFNLVGKTPSVGSNIYISYEGRNPLKKVLNYLPGIHLSMLGLKNSEGTNFTIGFVTSIVPFLRGYFGIFYGWYNLKNPVVGITLSPDINIKPMVVSEKSSVK
jgi:hypothetical protein